MNIQMAGIDFNNASIEHREKFALTATAQAQLLTYCTGLQGVSGSVIINTCNRTELWLSCQEGAEINPYQILCGYFKADPETNRGFFSERSGAAAVSHLFELACGLKSMVFGEEQILSQVKDAIAFAQECKTSDAVLQAMFRWAVTAAKKAKTEVRLQAVDRSIAGTAVNFLKQAIGDLHGVPCLVIGNGEMGRLAAKGLVSEGCRVNITLRQYKSGDAIIPSGCKAVDYEDRYRILHDARIIISATRSPHHTLIYEQVKAQVGDGEKIMFDLALPRDIDPAVGTLPNVRLYDIDHLGGRLVDDSDNIGIARVKAIIAEGIGEFNRWQTARMLMPKINEIGALAAADATARLRSSLKNAALDDACLQLIDEAAAKAVEHVVENMLLCLQKNGGHALLAGVLPEAKASIENGLSDNNRPLPLRFPLFVDLTARRVAVIGAGPVALRRILALCSYPCTIRVIAPDALPEIEQLHAEGKITYVKKAYDSSDLDGAYLVIAATNDRALNSRIALDARMNGQYCSVGDCKEECSFYFPATVHYDGGVIGICGTGENHKKTRKIAAEIREFISSKEQV
ncbi:MAG: glutamyl-tRNA reductase [Oscillospiraceae bacterium]